SCSSDSCVACSPRKRALPRFERLREPYLSLGPRAQARALTEKDRAALRAIAERIARAPPITYKRPGQARALVVVQSRLRSCYGMKMPCRSNIPSSLSPNVEFGPGSLT